MERKTAIKEARSLFGNNFIGPEELGRYRTQLGVLLPDVIPEIPYTAETLRAKSGNRLLVLSASYMSDGSPLTILSLRDKFGVDPKLSEPCFYNQDWYLQERFAGKQLECRWNLIGLSVLDESRSKSPEVLAKTSPFPSAVLCAYVFFLGWFHFPRVLWEHDFVWCDDVDHNGDRIYVGNYHDIAGVNKNGFSVHRHLALRDCYGSVCFE